MPKTVIGKFQMVDSAGITRKQMFLPGEVSNSLITLFEKSAEVIVPEETSWGKINKLWRSHKSGKD